jgi:hypothetical protein
MRRGYEYQSPFDQNSNTFVRAAAENARIPVPDGIGRDIDGHVGEYWPPGARHLANPINPDEPATNLSSALLNSVPMDSAASGASVAAHSSFRVRLHRRSRSTNPDRSPRRGKTWRHPMPPGIFASCVVSTANQTCSTAVHQPCRWLRKTASVAKAVRLRSTIASEAGPRFPPSVLKLVRNPTMRSIHETSASYAAWRRSESNARKI